MKKRVKENWILATILVVITIVIAYMTYNYTHGGVLFSPENYIYNPNFNGDAGWNFGYEQDNGSVSVFDNKLKINNYGFAFQEIPELKEAIGKTFTLSFWMKKDPGVIAIVSIKDHINWAGKKFFYPDSTSWKKYSYTFKVDDAWSTPENPQIIILEGWKGSVGTIYYDDIQLVEVSGNNCYWSPNPSEPNGAKTENNQLMYTTMDNVNYYLEERLLCYNGRWYSTKDDWSYWSYSSERPWGYVTKNLGEKVNGWKVVSDIFWGLKWEKDSSIEEQEENPEDGLIVIDPYENPDGKTWYVRPTGYGNQDGSSYNNAWNGLNEIVWGTNGVKAGDKLYVCGTHVYETNSLNGIASQANIVISESGTKDKPITIRMDCPNDEGVVWGVFKDNSRDVKWNGPDDNNVYWTGDLKYGAAVEFNGEDYIWLDKMNSSTWENHNGAYYSTTREGEDWLTDITYVKTSDGSNPAGKIYSPSFGYTFDLAGSDYINFYKCNLYGSVIRKNRVKDFPNGPISDHVTIDSCDIKYGMDYGALFLLYKGNDYWTIKNSELSQATNAIYTKTLDGVPGARFLTVDNNYIHNIGGSNFIDQDSHGVGIQGGEGHIIQNNFIENTGSAIEFWSSADKMFNMTVRYNFIKNIYVKRITGGNGIVISGDRYATVGKRKDFKIYQNIIMNTGIGATDFDWQGVGISSNNLDPVKIYNNVIYNTTLGIRLSPNSGSVSGEVYNNMIVNPRAESYAKITRRGVLSPLRWDYNLYSPADNLRETGLSDPHPVIDNPLFVSSQPKNAKDFKLQFNSPAINKGKKVGLTRDFEGVEITSKMIPDIGAFESV